MIDLGKLINLLPNYFKEKDTYKDSKGEGILERFLNVCGSYFKEEIVPDIDNILDIISLEKRDTLSSRDYVFLSYLWEFLGSIPYGYAALYDGNDINNPWKENMNMVPRAKYYDILKYSISLYKIRGTLDFYTILMRFYDIGCTVEDPTNGEGYRDDDYVNTHYDSEAKYDEGPTYDYYLDCLSCTKVKITLDMKNIPKDQITDIVKERILILLNRFRPVNVYEFDLTNVNFINDK